MIRTTSIGLVLASLLAAGCSRDGVQTAPKATQVPATPAAGMGTGIGDTIPEFTAETIDLTGQSEVRAPFDSHKIKAITVYAFLGTHCPTTQMYLDRLREVETTYRQKGVDFVYIYPNRTDPSDLKRTYHREQHFAGPMIDDVGAKIAIATLRAQRTAEILVTDAGGVIRYRGAIDDNKEVAQVTRRHLAVALDEMLAGKPVSQAKTNVFA
jgi:hypothetical protein